MENERLIQDAISHAIPSNEGLKTQSKFSVKSHFQIYFEIWNKVSHKYMFETHYY
jgi:hypothetical protein